MTPMQGNRDQPGSTIFYSFLLTAGPGNPVKDPRLCQGECAENGTCRAWSYHVPDREYEVKNGKIIPHAPMCWLKSNKVDPKEDWCCSSGVKK